MMAMTSRWAEPPPDDLERIEAIARFLVADPATADDVAQDVRLAALTRTLREPARRRAWLFAAARNRVRTLFRESERRRRREQAAARPEAAPSAADLAARAECAALVRRAVAELPEKLRAAVELRYGEGLSPEETAARLDVPVETARSRLRLARERLRARLAPAAGAAAPPLGALAILAGRTGESTSVASAGAAAGGGLLVSTTMHVVIAAGAAIALGASFLVGRASAPEIAPPAASAPTAAAVSPAPSPADTGAGTEIEALRREVARLQAENASLAARTRGGSPAPAPVPAAPPRAPAPAGPTAEQAKILEGLAAEPGTPPHLQALTELVAVLEAAADAEDHARVRWADGLLENEARRERVTVGEAAALEAEFRRLPEGHPARPAASAVVGAGFARDSRLAQFLAGIRPTAEPDVHSRLARILDHHPSRAFADYGVRILREAEDRRVLGAFLDEDRIAAFAAGGRAAELGRVLADRIRASRDEKHKEDYYVALALAAHANPDAALPELRNAAAAETDERLAKSATAIAERIARREATPREIEDAFD